MESALQFVPDDIGILRRAEQGRRRPEESIRIGAVDYVDMVASGGQRVGEPIDLNSIPSEVPGRIKRGQMKEVQRPVHGFPTR